jgi:hypothetical protein
MAILREDIEALTKSYFSESQLLDFLAIIKYWNDRSAKTFFQLAQKKDKPVIEYACLVNKAIYDITFAADQIGYGILPLREVKSVILNKDSSSTELIILASDTVRFFYKATTEQFRRDLEDFAQYMQMLIAGEK